MSKLKSNTASKLHLSARPQDLDKFNPEVGGTSTTATRSRDEGVWTASLFLAFVAVFVPLWFLGTAMAIASGGDPAVAGSGIEPSVSARALQIALVAIGAVSVWCGVRVSFTLARVPRLQNGSYPATMRGLGFIAAVTTLLFIQRFMYNTAGLASDTLAYIGAVAPALLMAEVSFALPAITRRRHGAAIGGFGGFAWAATGCAIVAVGFAPTMWWLPMAFAVAGAFCTGTAAIRVWRRYEGSAATG